MRMRLRPRRGERLITLGGGEVTVVEVLEKDFVKVYGAEGKIFSVPKKGLNLPVIDTRDYERIPDNE